MSRNKFPLCSLLMAAICLVACAESSFAILLEKPIDCRIGQDCFIQNYVDLAPGKDYCDAFGGALSYDKHKGVDFRVSFEQMQAGVAVKAAAPGVVRGMRDGVADISIRQGGLEAVKGRECGNGVVLVHPDGTQTQYCHMRQGSLRVQAGQQVGTGQELGLVGLSGETEFPHLHFQVLVNGQYVSPFTGQPMESGCAATVKHPLWTDPALQSMPYVPSGALDAGFGIEQPDINTVFVGGKKTERLTGDSPQLLFWAGFWGVHKDDVVTLRITTPTGEVWTMEPQVMPRNKAQILPFFGKRRSQAWPAGTYTGEAVLTRQGTVVASLSRSVAIEAPAR
uniref:Metalloendopeptidase-like membrane protein n=1 Tax=Desulfovibrio sp. U5L TaxID=596152 RepID=I2Q7Q1_9BACT